MIYKSTFMCIAVNIVMLLRCQKSFATDMNIVTFLSDRLCVYCVFTQKNTHIIFEYEDYHAIIRIIIDSLRVMCYNGRRY